MEIPEEGEFVLVTVNQITSHGVYVSLDEYNRMRGFLHRSQVATGRVRHIERFIRVGQKEVLKVIRVSRAREEVDLSLKQVTRQDKKDKLIDVKQREKAKNIIEMVRSKLDLSREENYKFQSALENQFGTLYQALEDVTKEGGKVLSGLGLPQVYIDSLEEVAKEKITLPKVKIKGILEVSSPLSNGIEIVKKALSTAEKLETFSAKILISYVSAPKYRLVVEAGDYKEAEKILKKAVEVVQNEMKKKGTMKFLRKPR
ncbi:MAG: translation initiation factor IF-2 subunit alpha [Nitrososphaerales archaeon]